MNDIKELNKWRDVPCSWVGRQNCQDVIIPTLIYRFNKYQSEFQQVILWIINEMIVKFIWKGKRPRISQHNTEEKRPS